MTLADGQRVTRTVKWWYVEYTDAAGKTRRRKAAPTQALAREILARTEAEVAKEKAGLPAQSAAEMALADLTERYLRSQASRVGRVHLGNIRQRIGAVAAFARARSVRDLTPERVDAFLATLFDQSPPAAPRTVNGYLQAVKGMLNWAVSMRILAFNPLACLKPRALAGRFAVRRAFTGEELARLFAAAREGPFLRQKEKHHRERAAEPAGLYEEARRMGERNRLIYRILVYTGLRLNELRTLRWSDLDLEGARLTVRAAAAKNRRQAVLDLPGGLVEELAALRGQGPAAPTDLVIRVPATILKTFNADLGLAGIPKVDEAGRKVDLHSLRHTYGTMLVRSGADIKTVQTLMRHSTPSMTLGIYVHYDSAKLREAVAALPRIGEPEPVAIAAPEAVAS